MQTIVDRLQAKGLTPVDNASATQFIRRVSMFTGEAIDKNNNPVFVKVGKCGLLYRGEGYRTYRLLQWIENNPPSVELISFPRVLDFFRDRSYWFLVMEKVPSSDTAWNEWSETARFNLYLDVVAELAEIRGVPRAVEHYTHSVILKMLARYCTDLLRQTEYVSNGLIEQAMKTIRRNGPLFKRYDGVFSHNDVHAGNLLCRSVKPGRNMVLVDLEACRVGNLFSDYSRCFNRLHVRTSRHYFIASGELRIFDCDEQYEQILSKFRGYTDAQKMFDMMLLVDSIMYLYFIFKYQQDQQIRRFTDRYSQRVIEQLLARVN